MLDIFAVCVLLFDLLFHRYIVVMVTRFIFQCMCELGLLSPVRRQISINCPALSSVW